MLPLTKEVQSEILGIKPFVAKLYRATTKHNSKKVLRAASDEELLTLSKLMHYIANKKVLLSKSKKAQLIRGRRMPFLIKNFQPESVLSLPKSDQLKLLEGLSSCLPALLHTCFFSD
jgi:hypothetical protein